MEHKKGIHHPKDPGTTSLAAAFVVGALLRAAFFLNNPHNLMPGDDEPWSKLYLAVQWLTTRHEPPLSFGPLHTFLLAGLWRLSPSHGVLLGRLFTAGCSLALMPVFYGALRASYGQAAARMGLWLLALYPLDILVSSASLAEPPAYLLLVSCLWGISPGGDRPDPVRLALSGAALTLACMLRFECWLFVPACAAWLLTGRGPGKSLAAFLPAAMLFPAAWMGYAAYASGDPLAFLHLSSSTFRFWMGRTGPGTLLWRFWIEQVQESTPPVILLALAGFAVSAAVERFRGFWAAAAVLLLGVFVFKTCNHSYDTSNPRYLYPLGLLLLPQAALAARLGCRALETRFRFPVRPLGLVVLTAFSLASQADNLLQLRIHPVHEMQTLCDWLRNHGAPNRTLLFEAGSYYPYLTLNSGLPLTRCLCYSGFPPVTPEPAADGMIAGADCLVLTRNFFLYRLLNDPTHPERLRHLRETVRIGPWIVYEKAPPELAAEGPAAAS